MPARTIVGTALIALLTLAASVLALPPLHGEAAGAIPQQRGDRPNIVVVMADDMRVDELQYMPSVQRLLGARGVEFANSFSPYPLCCPARASFLTGVYSHNHGVLSHVSPYGFGSFDDSRTLATALKRSGYRTGFVGKYLNRYGADPSGVTGEPSHRYVPPGWTDWHGSIENPGTRRFRNLGGAYAYFKPLYNVNGTVRSYRGRYQTTVLGQKARRLVSKYAKDDHPFFLYLSSVAPHHGAPREQDDPAPVVRDDGGTEAFKTPARPGWVKGHFDSVISTAPGIPADGSPVEADILDKPRTLHGLSEPNAAERDALLEVARQRAESLYVLDREIARLVERLKETREYRNTILVFTSDNGYFLGEHRIRTGKIKPYEPSLRVPMLVAGAGVPRGEVRYDPISTIDLTATIADYAGATGRMPYAPDGSSRVDTITGGDRGWRAPVVTSALMSGMQRSEVDPGAAEFRDARTSIGIRTARYKYVRYVNGDVELYDLQADPGEMESRHDDPAYADVRLQLEAVWRRYKDCAGGECTRRMDSDLRVGPELVRRITLRSLPSR